MKRRFQAYEAMIKLRGGDVCSVRPRRLWLMVLPAACATAHAKKASKPPNFRYARERALARFDELLFQAKTGRSSDPGSPSLKPLTPYLKALEREVQTWPKAATSLSLCRSIVNNLISWRHFSEMSDD